MANLNKLLVHVPSNLCDAFKTKYVDGTDRSYDSKVVFLEKTQEIFTKGKLYGTNIGDFNDLKALVGTIPSGATSTNIIDYINEKITSADHIHSVSKKSGETLIEVATENKNVTINSTSALTTAVSNANSAVQSVSVLGKTLNKTTNELTVEEAKEALGKELPMNIRVIRMRIQKRREADYLLHPEKYMRMSDGHLWRVKKKTLHYKLKSYNLFDPSKSSCEDLHFRSQEEAEDYWQSFCEQRVVEAVHNGSACDIQKLYHVLEIRQSDHDFLGYRLEQL